MHTIVFSSSTNETENQALDRANLVRYIHFVLKMHRHDLEADCTVL
jgi:hypothetical protein